MLIEPAHQRATEGSPAVTDPKLHYLAVNGLQVAWTSVGEASTSPLVFLHGLGDSAIITLRPIATHPAMAGTPALLIDLPGFGYGSATDDWTSSVEEQTEVVIQLLDTVGVVDAPIMGHSMGGSIAIQLATRRPDLVSSLILAEPLLHPDQSVLGRTIAKRTESDFVSRGYAMLQLATRRQAARGERASVGFQEPLGHANPVILHRAASSLLQQRSPSFGEQLEVLANPRTLLVGEMSNLDLGNLVPRDVGIVRIPDAGHSMMSENPDGFARAIAAVLGNYTANTDGMETR
ncbi:MAG TPA: alpha/beta hydrolase [Thermomicrobiales bacterium]|nr:alpha/beta hydrolase [Thermomicrobiales bacterium]